MSSPHPVPGWSTTRSQHTNAYGSCCDTLLCSVGPRIPRQVMHSSQWRVPWRQQSCRLQHVVPWSWDKGQCQSHSVAEPNYRTRWRGKSLESFPWSSEPYKSFFMLVRQGCCECGSRCGGRTQEGPLSGFAFTTAHLLMTGCGKPVLCVRCYKALKASRMAASSLLRPRALCGE